MNKIFLDVGFYRGMTLRRYIDQGIVDKSWKIYAFEPNPDLNTKQHIADFFGDVPIKLIESAVWTEDGATTFHISGRDDAAGIAYLTGHTAPKEVRVPTVDFSEFVKKLPEDSYVICSFDAEGAEYEVLEKMIEDDTINRINELDIEFHHRLMSLETAEDSQDLIDEILSRGIKLRLKVPLK